MLGRATRPSNKQTCAESDIVLNRRPLHMATVVFRECQPSFRHISTSRGVSEDGIAVDSKMTSSRASSQKPVRLDDRGSQDSLSSVAIDDRHLPLTTVLSYPTLTAASGFCRRSLSCEVFLESGKAYTASVVCLNGGGHQRTSGPSEGFRGFRVTLYSARPVQVRA